MKHYQLSSTFDFIILSEIHRNNYILAKNLSYKNNLINGYNKGQVNNENNKQISIKNGHVVTQKNFNNSMIKSLGAFSSKSFAQDLVKFESVK